MSGSDPTIRPGGGGGADQPCPNNLEVALGSPDPAVVEDLQVGDLLDVVSIETPIRGVGAYTLSGELVGAVTREILALRACLGRGVMYEAEVERIDGGAVHVVVRQQ